MRLGSRGSPLARWQAHFVQHRLQEMGQACTIEIIQTTGDQRTDVSLAAIGGKGLFTQEIEDGLRDGRLDLAVHSLKDVPTRLPEGLTLAALMEREDPRDVLIAVSGTTLATLPPGARVGSSSLRRQAQARALRPDLQFVPVRGNVETRLRRWREGAVDALLLAAAGLKRLGIEQDIAERLDPAQFCPAVGQGVLAIETRANDEETNAIVAGLHHGPTGAAVTAERSVLARLECGCQSPVAAYARVEGTRLHLDALVACVDGSKLLRRQTEGDVSEAAELGQHVAEALLADGAAALLAPALH